MSDASAGGGTVSQLSLPVPFIELHQAYGITRGPFVPLTAQGKRMDREEMAGPVLDDPRIPSCSGPPPWPLTVAVCGVVGWREGLSCSVCWPCLCVSVRPWTLPDGRVSFQATLCGVEALSLPLGGQETGRRQGALSLLLSYE